VQLHLPASPYVGEGMGCPPALILVFTFMKSPSINVWMVTVTSLFYTITEHNHKLPAVGVVDPPSRGGNLRIPQMEILYA